MNYTERRIALSQDINNTWAIVAAIMSTTTPTAGTLQEELETLFNITYQTIKNKSDETRNKTTEDTP